VGPGSSMQYTIGTALDRAHEAGHTVELLVETHWVQGTVVANDGVGVVLEKDDREHCIVRLDRIAAVRVATGAPMRRRIPAGHDMAEPAFDGAMPMPGPRAASD
jgi:hypothetical protein